jgi:hypothetical protein
VKPNLAFGPIDSVAQYLLYLSVVVLGVLLPLLVQRWRTRREQAALLARTVRALNAEVAGNRRRVAASQQTLQSLHEKLTVFRDHRLALRRHHLAGGDAATQPAAPADTHGDISVPLVTRTAWDVARLAQALVLLPEERLNAYTRVYQMQELFSSDRAALLSVLMQIEQLDLPLDEVRIETLDAQLRILVVALATVQYQVGLAQGMLGAFDDALRGQPAPPHPHPST